MPKDELHLKCDCIDGSVINDVRGSLIFSFALDRPPEFKAFL